MYPPRRGPVAPPCTWDHSRSCSFVETKNLLSYSRKNIWCHLLGMWTKFRLRGWTLSSSFEEFAICSIGAKGFTSNSLSFAMGKIDINPLCASHWRNSSLGNTARITQASRRRFISWNTDPKQACEYLCWTYGGYGNHGLGWSRFFGL